MVLMERLRIKSIVDLAAEGNNGIDGAFTKDAVRFACKSSIVIYLHTVLRETSSSLLMARIDGPLPLSQRPFILWITFHSFNVLHSQYGD